MSRKRKYPTIELIRNDGVIWTRGHHAPEEFYKVWLEEEYHPDYGPTITVGEIVHDYWRICRVGEDCFYGEFEPGDYVFIPAEKGRGAMPVTVWYE